MAISRRRIAPKCMAALALVLLGLVLLTPRESSPGTRPASCFVESLLSAKPLPRPIQRHMYDCFLRDVASMEATGSHRRHPKRFRFTSFNIHFFTAGYSSIELGDTRSAVMEVIQKIDADAVALQEVPSSEVYKLEREFMKLGYAHMIFAPAPSVHTLKQDARRYVGDRLMVVLASRHRFSAEGAVAIGDGFAVFGAVHLGGSQVVAMYSVHLSVRCSPEQRRREMEQLLAHALDPHVAEDAGRPNPVMPHLSSMDSLLFLVGGDFQQPRQGDYPPHEWAVIAADLRAAGLPLNDGVETLFGQNGFKDARREAGDLRTEGVLAIRPEPPCVSAWNGVISDYIMFKVVPDTSSLFQLGSFSIWPTNISDHLPIFVDFD